MANDSEADRVLRVLLRFGLDEQSAQTTLKALDSEESAVADIAKQWDILRNQAGLSEKDTVTAIQGSVTGMKLQEDQILAIVKAYEDKQAAEAAASAKVQADLEAESDRLKQIQENTDMIAQSFTNVLGLGRAEVSFGRGLTSLGRLIGNDDITRIGQATTALGRFTSALGRLPQALQAVKGAWGSVSGLFASIGAVGTAGLGALAIQGVQTVQGVQQDIGGIGAAQDIQQRIANANADEQAKLRESLAAATAGKSSYELAQALIDFDESLKQADAHLGIFSTKFEDIGKGIQDFAAKSVAALQDAIDRQKQAVSAFDDYQKNISKSEKQYGDQRQKIVEDNEKQIASITERYARQNENAWTNFVKAQAHADQNYADQRLKILNSGVEEEHKAETSYYQQRAKAAESYNLEVQRMEQEHQVQMQRMEQDHGKKLRKLADDRDALGIEDEMEQYRTDRARAEDDYQRQAAQRNQDFGRQIAEMEANFKQQEQVRKDDRQKQLDELAKQKAEDDAQRKADFAAAAAEREKNKKEDLAQAAKDGKDKLDQAAQQHRDELQQIDDAWQTRRQQLGLWLAGEQAQMDNYMAARQADLQTWVNTHLSVPGATGPTTVERPTIGKNVPEFQAGGYTSGGLAQLHAGEFVANPQTTRLLEQLVGGQLTQQNLIGAMAGSGQNQPISISVNQTFSGQESNPATYKALMYQTITEVFDKAMRS